MIHRNPISKPLTVQFPSTGVMFAESIHHPDFRMEFRRDPFHKLIYVAHGRVTYEEIAARGSKEAPQGSLIVVPCRILHRLVDHVPSTLFLLCFENHFLHPTSGLHDIWQRILTRDKVVLNLQSLKEKMQYLWRASLLEQQIKLPGGSLMVKSHATQILVQLARIRELDPRMSAVDRVRQVVRRVEESFFENWNLNRAAEESGLSRRHFSSLFRKLCRKSFLLKLTELRLAHAGLLLKTGNSTISGAAFSCGFQDLSHFYRLFLKAYGTSPKRWIERNAKK